MHSKKIEYQDLQNPIQSELIKVQEKISEQLSSSDQQLAPILHMISQRQGKMLRPMLVLLCGKLVSDTCDEHIDYSAMVELIHMASLLHDDVIDKAQLRRGQSSANALWGNTAAVLLGDLLLSRAFMLAASSKRDGIAGLLGQTAQIICTGELKQNLLKGQFDLTEEDYFQILEAKTASLFRCSCQLGAMASGASKEQEEKSGQFGRQFGLAFQIADDLRDVLSSEKQEGKTLGTDLLQGKFTLPVIHWVNQDDSKKKARIELMATFEKPEQLIEQMQVSGSINYAIEQIQVRVNQAKQSLNSFPTHPAKESLLLFADKLVADIS